MQTMSTANVARTPEKDPHILLCLHSPPSPNNGIYTTAAATPPTNILIARIPEDRPGNAKDQTQLVVFSVVAVGL